MKGDSPRKDSDIIFFWGVYLGAKQGDIIDIKITDPNGAVIASHKEIQQFDKARQYYYIGKKRPSGGWKLGTYNGRIKVTRPDVSAQVFEKALDIY